MAASQCRDVELPTGVMVRRVQSAGDAAAYRDVQCRVHTHRSLEANQTLFKALFGSPASLVNQHVDALIASDHSGDIATALTYSADGTSGVYWVGTIPEARCRGVGTAITALVTNRALGGCSDLVILQAAPMGINLYHSLGFTDVVEYRRWTCAVDRPASAGPASVRISVD
jgi:ribosomal protein S18 acetylase RimI-like enzyme